MCYVMDTFSYFTSLNSNYQTLTTFCILAHVEFCDFAILGVTTLLLSQSSPETNSGNMKNLFIIFAFAGLSTITRFI